MGHATNQTGSISNCISNKINQTKSHGTQAKPIQPTKQLPLYPPSQAKPHLDVKDGPR